MFGSSVVAVVEDDEAMREALVELLQVLGLPCRAFDRAESFLAAYASGAFRCLITDVRLPGGSGLDLQQRLKELGSTMPVIIITSHTDPDIRSRALEGGALAYLTKPLADETLVRHLKSALQHDAAPGDGEKGTAPDG